MNKKDLIWILVFGCSASGCRSQRARLDNQTFTWRHYASCYSIMYFNNDVLNNSCQVVCSILEVSSTHCTPKSRRLYNRTRPRLLPVARNSLPAEKSTAVTCPNGVLDVGQFANAVKELRWIYVKVQNVGEGGRVRVVLTIRI